MDKISRGVWPTHDTKTSMSPTASEPVTYRLVPVINTYNGFKKALNIMTK